MATIPSSSSLSNSFPLASPPLKLHTLRPVVSFITRATDPESPPSDPSSQSSETAPDSTGDEFDNRLSRIQLKYRRLSGKKSEQRKARKSKTGSSSGSGSGANSSMYLPAVPLKEPVSDGLKVNFGFSPYSEKINGRIAMVGLSALILVELATGKSVLNFHTPSVVLLQIYFVTAVAALYIKIEKERKSVWPGPQ